MDHSRYFDMHMAEMQPRVPEWAKAERMEMSFPQQELWRYPEKVTAAKQNGKILYILSMISVFLKR